MRQYTICFQDDMPPSLVAYVNKVAFREYHGCEANITVGEGRYINDLPEGWILIERREN